MRVYDHLDQIDFELKDCPALPRAGRALMATPDHFDVSYVINPHMEGRVGTVDHQKAVVEWRRLRDAYETIGISTMAIEGAEGLPDMVFCANQTLPFYNPKTGEHGVVLSNMHAPERREEVAHFERYFRSLNHRTVRLPDDAGDFEGMGDALWHPGRYLLWGGYGFRTEKGVYGHVAEQLDVRIIALRLEDPDFYHLDTCLSMLDQRSALIYRGAFDDDGLALLEHFFDRLIEAPEDEARYGFACNAHCPDGRHVLIHHECPVTIRRLEAEGFTPLELDTTEYLKSGGSVFCMKQMFW